MQVLIKSNEGYAKLELCPMGYAHDTLRPIMGRKPHESRANVIGYSCNKCHKTWDTEWVPTWEKVDA